MTSMLLLPGIHSTATVSRNDIWQAQDIKNYTFHGISSHAAKAPEKGRSALDAAELMNVGVNYLHEHVPGDVRMHYAYIDNGLSGKCCSRISRR